MLIKLDINNLLHWYIPNGKTFLIAGPCSAESEDQLIQTALRLSQCKVSVFRAGIWKPRTKPGLFEGVGDEGLKWLKTVHNATNLPIAVEVANPYHIEKCFKYGIDILWIGARTTTNPFSVQAIADCLRGTQIPVMVKNPINPEIELWIGAIERLELAGITKVAAIHRGFSTAEKTVYRYEPKWRIPIELKRRYPNLPIICDPSHISGTAALLLSVAQKAVNLMFNGLMFETHINPPNALTDKQQQITPEELAQLLEKIIFTQELSEKKDYQLKIAHLREAIDEIDYKIIDLIAERMRVVKEIGEFKRKNNISIFQPKRWREIVQSRIQAAKEKKLTEGFILKIYEYIHEEAIRHQENVTDGDASKG